MKTILVLIFIMILGLYSCEKESTSAIQEDKKYTLEEILADSNWVEITDTLHYDDIEGYTYLRDNWNFNEIIIINNQEEYRNIETKSDTTHEFYKPNSLKYDIDFNYHTLIGAKTGASTRKYEKLIFKNNKLKQYYYFVKILSTMPEPNLHIRSFNFLLLPKVDTSYNFYVDTIQVWEYL